MGNGAWGVFGMWFVALLGYLIPSFLALARDHRNAWAIVATNVLLGWTAIGWVVALVWALTEARPKARAGS